MSPKLFGHGDLRLYLLHLLADQDRHGYDLIVELEGRFLGLYTPSAGTIYPRLAALEEEGLLTSRTEEGRRIYSLTDAGRRELEQRAEELGEIGRRIASSARGLASEIRAEVGSAVRDLRQEVMAAAREVRAEQRRATRGGPAAAARVADNVGPEVRRLQRDLQSFVTDVLAAARRYHLDRDRLRDMRDVLSDARSSLIAVFESGRDEASGAQD